MKMVQAKEVKVLRGGTDTVSVRIPEQFIFALDKEAKATLPELTSWHIGFLH